MARQHLDVAAVRAELAELRNEPAGGRRVSVLSLARRVGVPNTTFRRLYPELVEELSHDEGPPRPKPAEQVDTDQKTIERLRTRNRDLEENLEAAVAVIQRITLENARLSAQLDSLQSISSIQAQRRKHARADGGFTSDRQ